MSIFANSLAFLGESLVYNHEELSAYLSLPPKTIIFRLNTDKVTEQIMRNSGWGDASEIIKLDPYTFQITYPYSDWSGRFDAQSGKLTHVIAFNAEGITNLHDCFGQSHRLRAVFNMYNTNSVTDMSNLFEDCDYLVSIPYFDTSNVTDMSRMFSNAARIENIPLFNTSKVTNMGNMFDKSVSNIPLVIPAFDTSNVLNMNAMFQGNTRPFDLPTHLNYSKVIDVRYMFQYTYYANPDTIYPMYDILRTLPVVPSYHFAFRGCGEERDESVWRSLPEEWGGLY